MGWEKVQFKMKQAERALRELSLAKSREQFYDSLTLFLTAARAAVSVLSFEFGLREFEKGENATGAKRHLGLSAADKKKRQSFDAWFKQATTPVLTHPLKIDRDTDLHRGVSSARFRLPLGPGLLLESGRPIENPLVLRKNRWGPKIVGLPLDGPRPDDFYFQFDKTRSALAVCCNYLALIENLVEAAKAHVCSRATSDIEVSLTTIGSTGSPINLAPGNP